MVPHPRLTLPIPELGISKESRSSAYACGRLPARFDVRSPGIAVGPNTGFDRGEKAVDRGRVTCRHIDQSSRRTAVDREVHPPFFLVAGAAVDSHFLGGL